jgi:hypothetical protein
MTVSLAQNPNTPSETLRALSQTDDEATLRALAENPNTPLDCLFELAELFPGLFWRNPVLSLLLLEDPFLARRIPATTQEALVESIDAPGWFLSSMVEHQSTTLRAMVMRHPNLPSEQLDELVSSPLESTRRAVAANPKLSKEAALRLLHDGESSVAVAVVKNFVFQGDELEALWNKNDSWIFRALAENPNTSAKVLSRLSRQEASHLSLIAAHPNTDEETLEWLSLIPDARAKVAAHPRTGVGVLRVLSTDLDVGVRRAVLCNPMLPTSIGDQMVRAEPGLLPSNASVSPSLLESLLSSREEPLRYSAAFHPKSPSQLLTRLASDESLRVQCAVAGNSNTPASTLELLSKAGSIRIIAALASNPKTPNMLLWSLTKSGDVEVRTRVASNPGLSGWGVRELIQDGEREVRLALAKNSALSVNDLLRMRRDTDGSIKRAVRAAIRAKSRAQ